MRRLPLSDRLLRAMSDLHLLRQSVDRSYLDFVYRVDVLIDLLKTAGLWHGVPRPWVDVFLPGQVAEDFVTDTFAQLTFDDVGLAGFGLLFPIRRSTLTRRFFTVPASTTEWIFLLDIATSVPLSGPNTEFIAEKLARNPGSTNRPALGVARSTHRRRAHGPGGLGVAARLPLCQVHPPQDPLRPRSHPHPRGRGSGAGPPRNTRRASSVTSATM